MFQVFVRKASTRTFDLCCMEIKHMWQTWLTVKYLFLILGSPRSVFKSWSFFVFRTSTWFQSGSLGGIGLFFIQPPHACKKKSSHGSTFWSTVCKISNTYQKERKINTFFILWQLIKAFLPSTFCLLLCQF